MYINGCYAGNYYTYDVARLNNAKSLSENYIFIKNKGAIAFVASSHFGVVNYLNVYLNDLYTLMGHDDFGKVSEPFRPMRAKIITALPRISLYVRQNRWEYMEPCHNSDENHLIMMSRATVKISPTFIRLLTTISMSLRLFITGKAVSIPLQCWS
jgi:hypothetical protein